MNRTVFSSTQGGKAHRDMIIQEIQAASSASWISGKTVRLDIMCFAFTDTAISAALVEFLETTPGGEIRLLADWNQGAQSSPSVIRGLAELNDAKLQIRVKIDAPYHRNPETGEARWGYAQSHGMLHHKTMGISMQDIPERLILGSFNWSSRGSKAYENTLVLARDDQTKVTLDAFAEEFDALWADETVTMPLDQSAEFASKACKLISEGANLRNGAEIAALAGIGDKLSAIEMPKVEQSDDIIAAFSGRYLTASRPHYGFSTANRSRKLNLLRPSGKRKPAPVTINSIALEAIRSVPDGNPIEVAMYALSPRVPEYTALIEAAARGCRVRFILDGKLGLSMAKRLAHFANIKGLPIEICTTNRRMHQKYLVAPLDGIVVTGTANMTEDATARHADHRILFRNAPEMASAFSEDFQTIWKRVDNRPVHS